MADVSIEGSLVMNHHLEESAEGCDQYMGKVEAQANKEVSLIEVQKIPETRFSKRVQDQLLKTINEKQLPSLKKRPLEGTDLSDHNSFSVLSTENIAAIASGMGVVIPLDIFYKVDVIKDSNS
jgi:hypothetical protein